MAKIPLFAFALICPLISEACPLTVLEPYSPTNSPKRHTIRLEAKFAHCSSQQVFQCAKGRVVASEQVRSLRNGSIQWSAFCGPDQHHTGGASGQEATKGPDAEPDLGSSEISRALASDGGAGTPTEESYKQLKEAAAAQEVPEVIFSRALEHYKKQRSEGKTKRPCFMAADLTTPDLGKIWLLCVSPKVVVGMPTFFGSGKGSGCLDHPFRNSGSCAKYFGSKTGWCLPMGGAFRTGKSLRSNGSSRAFVSLEGLEPGKNDTARTRRVGFHRTVTYDGKPYDATIGPDKSQGCFTIPHDITDFGVDDLSAEAKGGSMPFYAYPSQADIQAFVKGESVYWNDRCKAEIGKPAFFSQSGSADVFDPASIMEDQVNYINDYIQE